MKDYDPAMSFNAEVAREYRDIQRGDEEQAVEEMEQSHHHSEASEMTKAKKRGCQCVSYPSVTDMV